MRLTLLLFATVGLAVACCVAPVAQPAPPAAEYGRPLYVERLGPTDYGAHNQNWQIVEDARGIMYVGNTDGVLEYDGSEWRRVTEDFDLPRTLAVDSLGRVFVGARNEIGYLSPSVTGRLGFVSLKSRLPESNRDFKDVWTAFALPDGVYFQSSQQIARWTEGVGMQVWTTTGRYHKAFGVAGRFYVREEGVGMLEARGDRLVLVEGGEQFADEKVDAAVPSRRGLLLITRTRGVIEWDLGGRTFAPFPTEIDDYLRTHRAYTARRLASAGHATTYAITTVGGGVVLMDTRGRHVDTLMESVGILPDDLVLDVHPDSQGGLWFALDNGLVRAATPTPVSWLGRQQGLEGLIETVHRVDGNLYAVTALGLYRLDADREGGGFEKLPGLDPFNPQAWSLAATPGGGALVAASSGIYELDAGVLRRVRDGEAFALHVSERRPRTAYAMTKSDLVALRRENGRWEDRGVVLEGVGEIRSAAEDASGWIWLAPRDGGLVRFNPATGHTDVYPPGEGLPHEYLTLARIGDRVVAVSTFGVSVEVTGGARPEFRPVRAIDEAVASILGGGQASIATDGRESLVLMLGHDVRRLRIAGGALVDETPHALHTLPYPARTAHVEPDGVVWVGTDQGLIRYDPSVPSAYGSPFAALIRSVEFGGREVFGGTFWDQGARTTQPNSFALEARYDDREVRFTFAAPSYNLPDLTEYQVRLAGYSDVWTAWSTTPFKEYTNLPEGDYRFEVRARNAQGVTSDPGAIAFTVLPPWFRTWWAYAAYVVLGIALVWAVSAWQVRKHRRSLATQTARAARLRRLNDRLHLTNESLRASDKLKDDLLANTSHELRTPLTAILGFSEMLLDTPDVEARDLAQGIQRGGERLLNTVNGLLDMFKLQSGTLELAPTEVDAASLVRGTAALLQPIATDRGLDLRVYPADLVLPARVDRDAIDRIVTNLVGNALKFTSEGGVTVTVDADAESIWLSIADSGIGIPDEFIPNLFTPFEQASTGMARTHEGTGLGLAIVRQLIDLMDGQIRVESTVGVGTLIQVQVPRWAAPVMSSSSAAPVSPSLTGGQVLCIGLGAVESTALRTRVEPSGSLCDADSLGRALREMRREAFDALFVGADNGDPKRIRMLRRVPGYAHTPIVRVGGAELDPVTLAEEGYTHQIALPLDDEVVTTVLEAALMHLDVALVGVD